jgi:hypothetical protein
VSERPEDLWVRKAREALDQIPGYRGYRLKEERRNADRRVRTAVADAYAVELARVERIGRELANARKLAEIGTVERASQTIRHFIDRVRTATPGYGGLFGDRDIDGIALDQLRMFDESLLLGVDELREAIAMLEAASASGQSLAPAADSVAEVMELQLLRLNTRNDVIESGRAASQESVQAALRPLSEVAPLDVYSARPGDAISILGDDHLIDAMIEVEGRPKSFRVFRIAREPETWLMVGREPDDPVLRLTPTEPAKVGFSIPGQAMRQIAAGSGDGEVVSDRGSNGLRAVRYALLEEADDPQTFGLVLDWDGERQAFVGSRTEPLDIEVFRRTEAAG